MMHDLVSALHSLHPGTTWVLRGSDYAGLEWLDVQVDKPAEATLIAERDRLQKAYDALDYQRKRATEYPPATDYLDAVVKGDKTQMQRYIDACLAVKARHPKPE